MFQSAEIIIEANFYCLFNKCHETLRSLHFNVLEVNESAGILEANKSTGWFVTLKSKVHIEPIKNSESSYLIRLEFENQSDEPSEKISPRERSKITNRFINQLISKPKSADQKAEDKKDTPIDVGD